MPTKTASQWLTFYDMQLKCWAAWALGSSPVMGASSSMWMGSRGSGQDFDDAMMMQVDGVIARMTLRNKTIIKGEYLKRNHYEESEYLSAMREFASEYEVDI